MPTPAIFLLAVLGLVIGPVVYSYAIRAGVRRPHAARVDCEWCGAEKRGLLGPCSSCGRPIRRREPVWWVVTAATFGAAAVVAGASWTIPAYVVFVVVTVVLTITDFDHKLIPNAVLYPGGGAALGLLTFGAILDGEVDRLPRSVAAGAGYFGVLFLVAVIARGGFGFGDVKLAALLGPFVAYQGWDLFLLSVFFTGAIGGIAAIGLLVFRRAGLGDELPYGPAMVLGAFCALVIGEPFLQWIR